MVLAVLFVLFAYFDQAENADLARAPLFLLLVVLVFQSLVLALKLVDFGHELLLLLMNMLDVLVELVYSDLLMPQLAPHFPLDLRYFLQHDVVRLLALIAGLGEPVVESLVLEDEQEVPAEQLLLVLTVRLIMS